MGARNEKGSIIIFLILWIASFSFVLSRGTYTYAAECSKDDILKMIDKGLTLEFIENVCQEQVPKDPMCCCENTNLIFVDPENYSGVWGPWGMENRMSAA